MAAITQDNVMSLLDALYARCLDGIPRVSPPIENMAQEYMDRHVLPRYAAKAMLKNQVIKCTTSGFISGLGGALVLPVALASIPANITNVLYVQMRMIACAAHMGGYDTHSDQVQTLVYACLAGISISDIIKKSAVEIGKKFAEKGIQKIPYEVIKKINQKAGFRLVTKFGETGAIRLASFIPVAGGIINGSMDYAGTKIIANRSYAWFIKGDFNADSDPVDIVDEQ